MSLFRRHFNRQEMSQDESGRQIIDQQVYLPSCVYGANFTADINGEWRASTESTVSPDDGADRALLLLCERASTVTRDYYVSRSAQAQASVNLAMNRRSASPEHEGQCSDIVVRARAKLYVSSQSSRAEEDYSSMLRGEQIRAARREEKIRSLATLLGEPGLGHIWLADRNPDMFSAFDGQSFDQFISRIPDTASDHPKYYVQILSRFIEDMSEEERKFALMVFESALNKMNRGDQSEQIRRIRDGYSNDSSDEV